jgi:CRP-like cAMP-binding protein
MSNIKSNLIGLLDDKDSIFSVLDEPDKEIIKKHNYCSLFKKGEIIFKEGDLPAGLVCLSEGKVKVIKEGVGGRGQIVRMSKPNDIIGYRALFAEDHYISSAIAIEDSIICIIEKEILFEIISRNGKLALAMLKEMALELGHSNERTVNLTQKHIRGRLAESLLFLVDTFGYEQDKKTIKIYLSREDIASLSNMTTSNAIKTLSAFASEEILELNGRKIKILDLPKLKKISKIG